MASRRKSTKNYDEGTTFTGFLLGLIVGAVIAIFQGPRFPWSSVRDVQNRIEEAVTHDPLASGIEEGKVVARRYHDQVQSSR